MKEKYFQVLLKDVHEEQEDLLTEFCFAHGAGGMAENLNFSQNNCSSKHSESLENLPLASCQHPTKLPIRQGSRRG